jgi:hypothetical protein
MVNRFPRREVVWQESPGTAALDDVEDGVKDLAQRMDPGTPGGFGSRKEGLQAAPFGVGEVGLWYAFLMLGILPSEFFRTPFRTVSGRSSQNFPSTHFGE